MSVSLCGWELSTCSGGFGRLGGHSSKTKDESFFSFTSRFHLQGCFLQEPPPLSQTCELLSCIIPLSSLILIIHPHPLMKGSHTHTPGKAIPSPRMLQLLLLYRNFKRLYQPFGSLNNFHFIDLLLWGDSFTLLNSPITARLQCKAFFFFFLRFRSVLR